MYYMNSSELFSLIKKVFSSKEVIIAGAVLLIYLNFVFMVSQYKKRPAQPKGKKKAQKVKVVIPAPEADGKEDDDEKDA